MTGQAAPVAQEWVTVQREPTRAVCEAIEAAMAAGRTDHAWLNAVATAPSHPCKSGEGAGDREAIARIIQREEFRPTCLNAALDDICALPPKTEHYAAADAILALAADATQTREAELVAALTEARLGFSALSGELDDETQLAWSKKHVAKIDTALSTPPATSPAIPEGKSGDGVGHIRDVPKLIEFVAMVSRMTHTGDDGWTPPSEDDSSDIVDSLIAKARELRSSEDATRTREAELVAASSAAALTLDNIIVQGGLSVCASDGVTGGDALTVLESLRAALNARGGA